MNKGLRTYFWKQTLQMQKELENGRTGRGNQRIRKRSLACLPKAVAQRDRQVGTWRKIQEPKYFQPLNWICEKGSLRSVWSYICEATPSVKHLVIGLGHCWSAGPRVRKIGWAQNGREQGQRGTCWYLCICHRAWPQWPSKWACYCFSSAFQNVCNFSLWSALRHNYS